MGLGEQARGSMTRAPILEPLSTSYRALCPSPFEGMYGFGWFYPAFPLTTHVGAIVTNRTTRFVVLNSYANGTALSESHFSFAEQDTTSTG